MIDSFVSTLRRAGELVQRRSEEVVQTARLRVEVFQLGRELDGLYARLGRAYHGNASVDTLEEIRGDIARVDQEIGAKEALIRELNEPQEEAGQGEDAPARSGTSPGPVTLGQGAAAVSATPAPAQPAFSPTPSSAPHQSRPDQDRSSQSTPVQSTAADALSVWREKEASRMSPDRTTSDQDSQKAPAPNPENADPLDPTKAGVPRAPDAPPTDATVGSGRPTPTEDTASMGDEAARDEMMRHQAMLKEGAAASKNPDPLANKGE